MSYASAYGKYSVQTFASYQSSIKFLIWNQVARGISIPFHIVLRLMLLASSSNPSHIARLPLPIVHHCSNLHLMCAVVCLVCNSRDWKISWKPSLGSERWLASIWIEWKRKKERKHKEKESWCKCPYCPTVCKNLATTPAANLLVHFRLAN